MPQQQTTFNMFKDLVFVWLLTVRTNAINTAHIVVTFVTINICGALKFTKNCPFDNIYGNSSLPRDIIVFIFQKVHKYTSDT